MIQSVQKLLLSLCGIFTILPGSAFAQDAVINKFRYGGGIDKGASDTVEILVVKHQLDMRGMIIKDFSPTGTTGNDNGGAFRFNTSSTLWQSVSAGTLIVLSFQGSNTDIDPSDCVLRLNVRDNAYFTSIPQDNFSLAKNDMVMLKAANVEKLGFAGNVHTLASASPVGALFDSITTHKLRAIDEATTSMPFVVALNPTATLADFNGNKREFAAIATSLVFGRGNTPTNQKFIDSLRYKQTATSVSLNQAHGALIYPNPSREYVYTPLHNSDITLYNLSGNKVLQTTAQNGAIDISSLSVGAYYVIILNNLKIYRSLLLIW